MLKLDIVLRRDTEEEEAKDDLEEDDELPSLVKQPYYQRNLYCQFNDSFSRPECSTKYLKIFQRTIVRISSQPSWLSEIITLISWNLSFVLLCVPVFTKSTGVVLVLSGAIQRIYLQICIKIVLHNWEELHFVRHCATFVIGLLVICASCVGSLLPV